MLPLVLESLVNIAQFLKINGTRPCSISKPAPRPYFTLAIAHCFAHLASHGQNRTDFFDLAAEDRSGGRSPQRGRDGPAIAPSAIALRRSQVPTGRAKLPPVPRPAYEGVPYSPARLPLAGLNSPRDAKQLLHSGAGTAIMRGVRVHRSKGGSYGESSQ